MCMMSTLNGLPVLDADDELQVSVTPDDLEAGNTDDPEQHPVAIALRRKRGVDAARVTKKEVLIKRGDTWWRYNAPKPSPNDHF
jgi:hypothetical protein